VNLGLGVEIKPTLDTYPATISFFCALILEEHSSRGTGRGSEREEASGRRSVALAWACDGSGRTCRRCTKESGAGRGL
jgi:hypothetical protein